MVAFTSVLTLAATLATFSLQTYANPATAIHELLARQAPTFDPNAIPSQCRQPCADLVTSMSNGCTSLDCICGSTVSSGMVACLQCGAPFMGASMAQSTYDQYANACKSAGRNVPSFTASDSSASSGSSGSSGPSGTSGASGPSSSSGSSTSSGSSGPSGSTGNGGAPRSQIAGAAVAGAVAAGLLLVA